MEEQEEQRKNFFKEAGSSVRKRLFGYVAAGLGLVAALAWNDAITSFIRRFFPSDGSSLVAKFVYAGFITVVIGVLLYFVERAQQKKD